MSKTEELVEVFRTASEPEAQVIRSLLESFDIPCLLRSNAAPSVHVFVYDGMGGVKVMVKKSMAEEALRLIHESTPSPEEIGVEGQDNPQGD